MAAPLNPKKLQNSLQHVPILREALSAFCRAGGCSRCLQRLPAVVPAADMLHHCLRKRVPWHLLVMQNHQKSFTARIGSGIWKARLASPHISGTQFSFVRLAGSDTKYMRDSLRSLRCARQGHRCQTEAPLSNGHRCRTGSSHPFKPHTRCIVHLQLCAIFRNLCVNAADDLG